MDEIKNLVQELFPPEQIEKALEELEQITLDHVMARSEFNLLNTRKAVVILSEGNLTDLTEYKNAALKDFRDVILWASQKNEG